MLLADVAIIKTNFRAADFWLVRRGSLATVGRPVDEFNPEHIGVKVLSTEILLPRFLYYVFLNYWNQGVWRQLANGSLELVNIKVSDVRAIKLRQG